MGNFLLGTLSESDEEWYKTPLESLKTESEPEHDDDPNTPELSEDNLENNEEVKELLNRPENDSAISLGGLGNFPDLLNLNKKGKHTYNSDIEDSDDEH